MTPSILSYLPRQLSLGLTVFLIDVNLPSGLTVFLTTHFFGVWGYPFPGLFVSKFSPSCGPMASKVFRFDAPIEGDWK